MNKALTLDEIMATMRGEVFGQEKTASAAAPVQAATPTPLTSNTDSVTDLESLLTKSAGVNVTTLEETSDMNKQAQVQGKAIADALIANIVKQANLNMGDFVDDRQPEKAPVDPTSKFRTGRGFADSHAQHVEAVKAFMAKNKIPLAVAGVVAAAGAGGAAAYNHSKQANAVAEDSTGMVMGQMAQQHATPREGMDVSNTLKGLLIQGIQNGGATNETSEMTGPSIDAAQGAVMGVTPTTPPAQPNGTALGSIGEMGPEQEKAAAVYSLVCDGVDFDHAVNLVKQAEEDLAGETIEMAKVAAVNEVMAAGYSMAQAVQWVEGSARNLGL